MCDTDVLLPKSSSCGTPCTLREAALTILRTLDLTAFMPTPLTKSAAMESIQDRFHSGCPNAITFQQELVPGPPPCDCGSIQKQAGPSADLTVVPVESRARNFIFVFGASGFFMTPPKKEAAAMAEIFKALVCNSSVVTGIYDATGQCKYMSPTSRAILGYEPDFFYQHNSYALIHPEDFDKVAIQFSEFAKGVKVNVVPYRYKHKSGEWRWMESYVTNLLDDPVVQGLIITSHDITERILLQQELEKKSRESQRTMTAAVIHAQETERSQIGQELHDNVNQVLTTVKLYTEMLLDGIGDREELLRKSVDYLQKSIDEIRSISKRLSAPTLGHISLPDSIKDLVEAVNLTRRLYVIHDIKGVTYELLDQETHLGVYRIVQEQINNIVKYAEASVAVISIEKTDKAIHLTVSDNGKGFDVHAKRKGIGITNMKTRAEHLRGKFSLQSEPGKGCKIRVDIPLVAEDRGPDKYRKVY